MSIKGAEGSWRRLDVTALVLQWLEGAPNYGFFLTSPGQPVPVYTYSSEAFMNQEDGMGGGDRVAYRPTLIVKPADAAK